MQLSARKQPTSHRYSRFDERPDSVPRSSGKVASLMNTTQCPRFCDPYLSASTRFGRPALLELFSQMTWASSPSPELDEGSGANSSSRLLPYPVRAIASLSDFELGEDGRLLDPLLFIPKPNHYSGRTLEIILTLISTKEMVHVHSSGLSLQ